MNQDYSSDIVVVTGAASGIGYSVAHYFASRGARVVGVDLNERIGELMTALPGALHQGICRNLTEPTAASEIITQIQQEIGTPTVLVNSAGVALLDDAVDVPAQRWQATLDVNLSASFYMAQAAGRVMIAAGYGRIINLASQAALIGLQQHAAYAASKGALLGLSKVLSKEWAPHGVTVNCISPTVVETPLGKAAWAGEKGEKAKAEIPVGRFARPEEIASLIGYLASPEAAMITGENVVIDGGRTTV